MSTESATTPIPPTPLDYAPVVKGRGLRRWMVRLLVVLVVGAAALSWYGWQWRLKQDEKAFNARARINAADGSDRKSTRLNSSHRH